MIHGVCANGGINNRYDIFSIIKNNFGDKCPTDVRRKPITLGRVSQRSLNDPGRNECVGRQFFNTFYPKVYNKCINNAMINEERKLLNTIVLIVQSNNE